jgi:hypothetical protein
MPVRYNRSGKTREEEIMSEGKAPELTAQAKAEYAKAAEELQTALAKIQKLKTGVAGLDTKMEDLEKALQ